MLDSLYIHKQLNKRQTKIVKEYYELTEDLNYYVNASAKSFNNVNTDNFARRRQHYQHHEIKKVIDQREEFVQRFVITSSGATISWRDAYKNLSDFWDLRNKTMAQNIIRVADKYPAKKIVVLTGFFSPVLPVQ